MSSEPGLLPVSEDVHCEETGLTSAVCNKTIAYFSVWGPYNRKGRNPFDCFACDRGQFREDNQFGLPRQCAVGFFPCAHKFYDVYDACHSRHQVYTPSVCCREGQLCVKPLGYFSDRPSDEGHCEDIPSNPPTLTDQSFNKGSATSAAAVLSGVIGGTYQFVYSRTQE
jgi:hypothetical protein